MSFIKALGAAMESRFRYRFFGPLPILQGAGLRPGQTVLEVGCGTGFFTLPAGRLLGTSGSLVAMDVLAESVALVSDKVSAAGLRNIRTLMADALDTGLDAGAFDVVLLFGVIPAPMLPLGRLLSEMHRVLKAGGTLAVWPPVPGWLPRAVVQSRLFEYAGKLTNVHNFRK